MTIRPEALKALNDFDDALTNIVAEHLLEVVTPEEVNESYGYSSRHPVAERLQELIDEQEEDFKRMHNQPTPAGNKPGRKPKP